MCSKDSPRLGHGARADPETLRQRPNSRQLGTGCDVTAVDQTADDSGDLARVEVGAAGTVFGPSGRNDQIENSGVRHFCTIQRIIARRTPGYLTEGMSTKAELFARYRNSLPPFLSPYYSDPVQITHGEGSYVFDADGGRYLDFFGGVLTTMVGHNNPAVTAALQAQAGKVVHTSSLYLNEAMIEVAERIAGLSGIPDARVFLTPSGTEANDAAILLATNYRKSNQILAMRNSYHGRSHSTQAITSHASWASTSNSGLKVTFVQLSLIHI